jgi:hypothetical protein
MIGKTLIQFKSISKMVIKHSKATPWANGTEQPNARVPVPCGGRVEQME